MEMTRKLSLPFKAIFISAIVVGCADGMRGSRDLNGARSFVNESESATQAVGGREAPLTLDDIPDRPGSDPRLAQFGVSDTLRRPRQGLASRIVNVRFQQAQRQRSLVVQLRDSSGQTQDLQFDLPAPRPGQTQTEVTRLVARNAPQYTLQGRFNFENAPTRQGGQTQIEVGELKLVELSSASLNGNTPAQPVQSATILTREVPGDASLIPSTTGATSPNSNAATEAQNATRLRHARIRNITVLNDPENTSAAPVPPAAPPAAPRAQASPAASPVAAPSPARQEARRTEGVSFVQVELRERPEDERPAVEINVPARRTQDGVFYDAVSTSGVEGATLIGNSGRRGRTLYELTFGRAAEVVTGLLTVRSQVRETPPAVAPAPQPVHQAPSQPTPPAAGQSQQPPATDAQGRPLPLPPPPVPPPDDDYDDLPPPPPPMPGAPPAPPAAPAARPVAPRVTMTERAFIRANIDGANNPQILATLADMESNTSLPAVRSVVERIQKNEFVRNYRGKPRSEGKYFREFLLTGFYAVRWLERIFESFNVPGPLALITLRESGFFKMAGRNIANFPIETAGFSVGPYQLETKTAQRFGMLAFDFPGGRIDSRDERNFLIPSACAAAKKLTYVIDMFKGADRTLAIMAYNRGEGAVGGTIASAAGIDRIDRSRYREFIRNLHQYPGLKFRQLADSVLTDEQEDYVNEILGLYVANADLQAVGLSLPPDSPFRVPNEKLAPAQFNDRACGELWNSIRASTR